jgi:hypothetical protein
MRLKHYLLIGLIAWLGAHLPFDLRWPIDRNPFAPLVAHAQQGGYGGWQNIHMAHVTADWTDGSGVTTLQNIPALQLSLPANQTGNFWIDCTLAFSQATNVADNFGVQFGVAPTNSLWSGLANTNGTTAYASGTPATISGTSATNVIAFTPSVTTVLVARMWGFVEEALNGQDNIINFSVAQSTAADVIVVKRDSACMAHSVN